MVNKRKQDALLSRVTLRDYKPEDYPEILSLWDDTGLGGVQRGDNHLVIERSIRMGGKLLVATLDDNSLVGSSWLTYDGRRLHLHHIGVQEKYQGKGIGRMLTKASMKYARERGIQLKLEVHSSNTGAIALYKDLGFERLGDYEVYIIRQFS